MTCQTSCLRIQDRSSAVLRPNPTFTPKSITNSCKSRFIMLVELSLPPHNSEKEANSHLLCHVHMLTCYVKRTAALHKSDCLFIHFRNQSQVKPLFPQCLSQWLCETISQAYSSSGLRPPDGLRAHSARGISTSTALHEGISVQDICSAAS